MTETLAGALPDGRQVTVKANFAGLSGYLMAKLVSARERGKAKDYYDLAYVLLHNSVGGPAEAGQQLGDGQFAADIEERKPLLREIKARSSSPHDVGPTAFARESLLIEPDAEEAVLRQDAVGAVELFVHELDIDLA